MSDKSAIPVILCNTINCYCTTKSSETINEILSKNQTKNKFPKVFNDDGSMIADRVNIANKFNVFFTNIGEKIAKGINYDGNKNYDNYLNKRDTFIFHEYR